MPLDKRTVACPRAAASESCLPRSRKGRVGDQSFFWSTPPCTHSSGLAANPDADALFDDRACPQRPIIAAAVSRNGTVTVGPVANQIFVWCVPSTSMDIIPALDSKLGTFVLLEYRLGLKRLKSRTPTYLRTYAEYSHCPASGPWLWLGVRRQSRAVAIYALHQQRTTRSADGRCRARPRSSIEPRSPPSTIVVSSVFPRLDSERARKN